MLVNQRNQWRKAFEAGEVPMWPPLEIYRDHRNSESFRTSSMGERFHEYVIYLEDELRKCKEKEI